MSYGVQILTSTGNEASDVLNSYGLFYKLHCTSQEGTATIPDFDSNNGFYFTRIVNSLRFQKLAWNNTTKVITWTKAGPASGAAYSSDFHILFFRGAV